jgi:2-polyprenyl-3-methyl-5-hydroxy-6-metoxy-1,4-benzoquinol methylase
MLEEFKSKEDNFACDTKVLECDLSTESIAENFDGIISSMTLHHLEDTTALFRKFYTMLNKDGFIAIADLDSEAGNFHSDNTGVFHYGFDRQALMLCAKEAGFKDISFSLASTINKPKATFTVFLMMAKK